MMHTTKHYIFQSKSFSLAVSAALAIAISMTSCGGQKGSLEGDISGAEGKTIYLERFVNNRMVFTDSTIIGSDGSFLISPSKPLELNYYRLVIDKDNSIALITDSTESPSLKATYGDLEKSLSVCGSENSETLHELSLHVLSDAREIKVARWISACFKKTKQM